MKSYFFGLIFIAISISFASKSFANSPEDGNNAQTIKAQSRKAYPLPNMKKFAPQDGISLSKIDHFWDKWKLLNVRYRTDNGEQRFIYADPIAWKAIQSGAKKFPDGAQLGKVAFFTQVDPSFPVSLEPNSFSRLQIMKKDSKKYPETDGWGYAVATAISIDKGTLTQDSLTTGQKEDRKVAITCHACHKLAPERDFVFTVSPFVESSKLKEGVVFKSKFIAKAISSLKSAENSNVESFLRENPELNSSQTPTVKYFSMPLFSGSVNESAAIIAQYASNENAFYYLSDPKSEHFLMAYLPKHLQATTDCVPGTKVAVTISQSPDGIKPTHIKYGRYCSGTLKWEKLKTLH